MEKEVENEKITKYLGTARVQLQWLSFQHSELNAKHVQVLKLSFEKDCRRLDARNHIPAIIDQQNLNSALQLSGVSQGQLFQCSHQPLELGFWPGYQLECLHGRHRVQAAKLALAPSNKWWTVDLYLADISSDLRTALTEEYANEERPSDGKMYEKIRQYQRKKQTSLEVRWLTRMSRHKKSNLTRLLKHHDYTLAFDSFSELPALLTGMRISTLHKMFAIRCDEEILHYLHYIKEFWSELVQHDKTAMAKVDQLTVEELQLKAPWASTTDARVLRRKVLEGKIFGLFSQQEREQIWTKLQDFKGVVPSLFEFFENLKCLESWTDCLKWLITLKPRETVFMAMERIHVDNNQRIDSAVVQESETIFQTVPASPQCRLALAYRQLYAFAMRYHRDIPKKPTGKDLLARPTPTVSATRLGQMADLARRLGFESSEINALREHLRSVDSTATTGSHKPSLVTGGPGEAERYRCGIPRIENYKENAAYLFIRHLHDNRHEQGEGITSFFRLRSTYLKFFSMPYSISSENGGVLDVDIQQPRMPVEDSSRPPTPGTDQPEHHQTRGLEATSVDEDSNEIGEILETASFEPHPRPLSAASSPKEQADQVEQVMQYPSRDASLLQEQIQKHHQLQNELASSAGALQEQGRRQGQLRRKLTQESNALKIQGQELDFHRRQLNLNADAASGQTQQQEHAQKNPAYEVSELMSPVQGYKEERKMLALAASEVATPEKEPQARQDIKGADKPKNRGRQKKTQRRLKQEKVKRNESRTEEDGMKRSQDELHSLQEQEERLNGESQRQSQERLFDLEEMSLSESVPQGALADGSIYEARVEDSPTEAAQKENTIMQQEDRNYSITYNEGRVEEDRLDKSPTLCGRGIKRGRERREEVEDNEIRTRQEERGQLYVNEGKFRRLN